MKPSGKHAGKLMAVVLALVIALWLVEPQKQAPALEARFYLAKNIVSIVLPPEGQSWRYYARREHWNADFRTWMSAAEFIYEVETS